MAEFDPALRPLETSPLAPLRERRRRGGERAFDLARELAGQARPPSDEPVSDPEAQADPETSPVAPRAEDEAGGRLDVTA